MDDLEEFLNELDIPEDWDADESQDAIVRRFVQHYAELDRTINEARAERDYDDDKPIVFLWDADQQRLVRYQHDNEARAALGVTS